MTTNELEGRALHEAAARAMGCTGLGWRHSGNGYNRVRVCLCGAEDHDPEPKSIAQLAEDAKQIVKAIRARREAGQAKEPT